MSKLKELLVNAKNQIDVDNFISYCNKSTLAKNKNGSLIHPHFQKATPKMLAEMYYKVEAEGLKFDGKHVSFQRNGITYDYVAYKNKMLIAYPNTLIDLDLVYKKDTFNSRKESGKVIYNHIQVDVFNRTEKDIIGAYCVVKNARGEFITTLTLLELEKHRKVAKTQYIWDGWLSEMYRKTIAKKAFKIHFDDIFETMNETDNNNYDLTKSVTEDEVRVEMLLNNAETVDELENIMDENRKEISKIPRLNKLFIKNKQMLEL